MEQKEDYLVALDNSKTEEWFSDLYRRYFDNFHWSIPDDAEPDEHDAVIIDEDIPADEREDYEDLRATYYDTRKKVRC